jgi:hypothetical protein
VRTGVSRSVHAAAANGGLSASTANGTVRVLRRSLNLAIQWGIYEGPNVCAKFLLFHEDNVVDSNKISLPENFEYVLDRFLTIQSYPFMDSLDRYDEFVADMIRWRPEGRMHLEECVYDGLERAPAALCALLEGQHIGKPLVRLAG